MKLPAIYAKAPTNWLLLDVKYVIRCLGLAAALCLCQQPALSATNPVSAEHRHDPARIKRNPYLKPLETTRDFLFNPHVDLSVDGPETGSSLILRHVTNEHSSKMADIRTDMGLNSATKKLTRHMNELIHFLSHSETAPQNLATTDNNSSFALSISATQRVLEYIEATGREFESLAVTDPLSTVRMHHYLEQAKDIAREMYGSLAHTDQSYRQSGFQEQSNILESLANAIEDRSPRNLGELQAQVSSAKEQTNKKAFDENIATEDVLIDHSFNSYAANWITENLAGYRLVDVAELFIAAGITSAEDRPNLQKVHSYLETMGIDHRWLGQVRLNGIAEGLGALGIFAPNRNVRYRPKDRNIWTENGYLSIQL